MTCRGFIKVLLKVINVLFTIIGLAMIGYGIYLVFIYEKSSSSTSPPPPPPPPSPPPPSAPPPSTIAPTPSPASEEMYSQYTLPQWGSDGNEWVFNGRDVLQSRRSLLQKSSSFELGSFSSFLSSLSTAWFVYAFIGVGLIITLITCSGCLAASTVNGCCLSCYAFFVGLFIIIQLSLAAFIYFYDNWQDVIPNDSTGELEMIEDFIQDKFGILKWVALAIIILQVIALVFAMILRGLGSSAGTDYDSDEEYLGLRSNRQPMNRQGGTGTGGNVDNPSRAMAWSTRMREKYGLDTKDYSNKPDDSRQYGQQSTTATEERQSKCRIM